MSDDVRCLLRLPRQWQLQVWRWVPFQPRSIGHMSDSCLNKTPDLRFILWSVKKVLLSCTCAVVGYLHVLDLYVLDPLFGSFSIFSKLNREVRTWQMSPAKVSWAGKQMRERFCFPGKVTTSSCVSCHEFQCNSAMSMHQAWCAVTNWANLRHQPVVQAVLIASVHDTVALCTILHNLALCHI